MPDIRDMELLTALAQHNHFARAAEACGISQPAFSARIRNLEIELGTPIVKRGNRFLGFTEEGEIALRWARQVLANMDGFDQEIAVARGALSSRLVIASVPTALSYASALPAKLHDAHPDLRIEVHSASQSEILRGLEDFSFDAGVTYLEGKPAAGIRQLPLYDESYVLLAPTSLLDDALLDDTKLDDKANTIRWIQAAELPLCLLSRNMRNRRIIDEVFESQNCAPKPVLETNAFTVALAQVATGVAATIAPASLAERFPIGAETQVRKLVEPDVRKAIGLMVLERDPLPPTVSALLGVI